MANDDDMMSGGRNVAAHVPRGDARPARRRKQGMGRELAVQVAVANIFREPNSAAEVVTQVLLGAPVKVYPTPQGPEGWARVRLADYAGWTTTAALGLPATTMRLARLAERVAVVTAPTATLYTEATGDEALTPPVVMSIGIVMAFPISTGPLVAYATTTLPLLAEGADRIQVAAPGKLVGWLERDAIAIRPVGDARPYLGPAVALELARRLLDVPYLWGGVTAQGLDCSGLTQLCCRQAGVVIPRDADQQYRALSYVVSCGEVTTGDLLFFGQDGAVTHVGFALDNTHILHANGHAGKVTVDALDPNDADFTEYGARLRSMYVGARRPFVADGGAHIAVVALRGAVDEAVGDGA